MKPEREHELEQRMDRASKLIRISKVLMVIVLAIMIILVLVQELATQNQIQDSIKQLEAAGSANHQRTQQYVKCVADVLLKPIDQRSPSDFDKCGLGGTSKSGTQQPETTAPQSSPTSTNAGPVRPQPHPNTSSAPAKPSSSPLPSASPSSKPSASGNPIITPLLNWLRGLGL